MDYTSIEGAKQINKILRKKLYGYNDEDIEKADKEELYGDKESLKAKLNVVENELVETKKDSKLSDEQVLKLLTKRIIRAIIAPNGYLKIQQAKKEKRLLLLLSSGEKSKKDLEKRVPTKNLKDLIRDTNKTLIGCMTNDNIKIVSCKDNKMPGVYKIKFAPIENN